MYGRKTYTARNGLRIYSPRGSALLLRLALTLLFVASALSVLSCAGIPRAPESGPEEAAKDSPESGETSAPDGPKAEDEDPRVAVEARVEALLDEIGLRGQIGQHFIIPLKTSQVYARTEKRIRHMRPAGFILYPWNIESREQTVSLTKALRRRSVAVTGTAPFVAVDQEGGRVQALRLPSLHEHPPARSMGTHADRGYMEAVGYVSGVELRSLGINMNFAPVLDLYDGSAGGVIGDRAFASGPSVVADLGVAYAGGLERAGVIAVGKHFPGHGATSVDSHGSLPEVRLGLAELSAGHLKPFTAAAAADLPAMMTAHIVYPRVEKDVPATLSSVWLQEVLRDQLGFEGVIVTDALEMRAIADNYSLKETLHLGLEAGVNLFLITSTIEPIEAVKAVESLVKHGVISKERIRAGARRVLTLKAGYGLVPELQSLP